MPTDKQIEAWPPLKKALWRVVTGSRLNSGYTNAWELTDKLYRAALTAAEQAEPAADAEPFAYAHPNGAIWRLDNYPAGMDFTINGWFPLYRTSPLPESRWREALEDLLSWFPEEPTKPEWRLEAGKNGADDAIAAARAALAQEGGR